MRNHNEILTLFGLGEEGGGRGQKVPALTLSINLTFPWQPYFDRHVFCNFDFLAFFNQNFAVFFVTFTFYIILVFI